MDEASTVEFVMSVVNKFETMQPAFTSISREQRDQTMKPRVFCPLSMDAEVPPVGTYRPRHDVVDKEQSSAMIMLPNGASKGKMSMDYTVELGNKDLLNLEKTPR